MHRISGIAGKGVRGVGCGRGDGAPACSAVPYRLGTESPLVVAQHVTRGVCRLLLYAWVEEDVDGPAAGEAYGEG